MKIRYKLFALALPTIFLMTIGLGWLALGLMTFGTLYILFTSPFPWVKWIKRNEWVSGVLSFIGIFVMAILLRLFVFEIFSIPSSSMEDTIQPGDHILLTKLPYGPQLPRSPFEIPWLNLFFFLNQEARAKAGVDWWEYQRWGGYSSINRNDIVVFKLPAENNQPYIKRCIGLPGEQFQMIDGETYCNGQKVAAPASLRNRYLLWPNDRRKASRMLDSLQVTLPGMFNQEEVWEVSLNGKEKKLLQESSVIDSIKAQLLRPGEGYTPFPFDDKYTWSIDYFGPIVIPAKGMKVALDTTSFLFYKDILRDFENLPVQEQDGRYFVDGREIKEHVFQQDYYFMLGDHRNDSKDSRFIGFVPEENVIGKAVFVLFSSGEDGFKWDRAFKLLD